MKEMVSNTKKQQKQQQHKNATFDWRVVLLIVSIVPLHQLESGSAEREKMRQQELHMFGVRVFALAKTIVTRLTVLRIIKPK